MVERIIKFTSAEDRRKKVSSRPTYQTLHIDFFPVVVTVDGVATERPWRHGDAEIGEVVLSNDYVDSLSDGAVEERRQVARAAGLEKLRSLGFSDAEVAGLFGLVL